MKHNKEPLVETAAMEMGSRLRQFFGSRVLGPDKPAVARVKTLHIRKLIIKIEPQLDGNRVRECLRYAQTTLLQDKRYAALQVYYDVDPM